MKRRLNILCVIVMLVLSYSVVETAYYMGLGVTTGVKAGTSLSQEQAKEMMNIQGISLMPDLEKGIFQDSVYNEKTGSYVPATYSQMAISIDTHPSLATRVFNSIISISHIIVVIIAIVLFIRLVISINKSNIFNWLNVRRLRRIGWLLVVSFICTLLPGLITIYNVEQVFSMRGYTLSISDFVDITALVLGLSALIVAEVFSIGLKMKEEQDLTI